MGSKQYKVNLSANLLVEVERMKRPLAGNFIDDEDNFYHALEVYNNHVASLRSYPLAPGHPWKEGEVIGEDQFEVRPYKPVFDSEEEVNEARGEGQRELTQIPTLYAYPLTPSTPEQTQEELWDEIRQELQEELLFTYGKEVYEYIKQYYTITKKTKQ